MDRSSFLVALSLITLFLVLAYGAMMYRRAQRAKRQEVHSAFAEHVEQPAPREEPRR